MFGCAPHPRFVHTNHCATMSSVYFGFAHNDVATVMGKIQELEKLMGPTSMFSSDRPPHAGIGTFPAKFGDSKEERALFSKLFGKLPKRTAEINPAKPQPPKGPTGSSKLEHDAHTTDEADGDDDGVGGGGGGGPSGQTGTEPPVLTAAPYVSPLHQADDASTWTSRDAKCSDEEQNKALRCTFPYLELGAAQILQDCYPGAELLYAVKLRTPFEDIDCDVSKPNTFVLVRHKLKATKIVQLCIVFNMPGLDDTPQEAVVQFEEIMFRPENPYKPVVTGGNIVEIVQSLPLRVVPVPGTMSLIASLRREVSAGRGEPSGGAGGSAGAAAGGSGD